MRAEAKALRQPPPPAGDAKAQAYARFIPREELSSFATWKPGALAAETHPAAEGDVGRADPGRAR